MRYRGWAVWGVACILCASVADAAMYASQNGAMLFGLAGEGGTYTSCTKTALSTQDDQPALIGVSCSGANKAFGFRFSTPPGENPTAINIGVSAMGNSQASQNACLTVACGCGGDDAAPAELENPTLGTAAVITIASADAWEVTQNQTTIVNSVDLENGSDNRSCTCRFVRGTSGGCTDNWTGALEIESVLFTW